MLSPDDITKWNALKNKFGTGRNYCVWPVEIDGENKFICFDFRFLSSTKDESLNDDNQFKLLFKANHKLFSDILQKFSSHAARLGLSLIEPNLKAANKKN